MVAYDPQLLAIARVLSPVEPVLRKCAHLHDFQNVSRGIIDVFACSRPKFSFLIFAVAST